MYFDKYMLESKYDIFFSFFFFFILRLDLITYFGGSEKRLAFGSGVGISFL